MKKMQKITLIGDSIRMGYESYVRHALTGVADVWGPEINGGDSRNILRHLQDWLRHGPPDIVHINCGLHDIKTPFTTGVTAVPIKEYSANIKAILSQLAQLAPTVIWATTTPVNSDWHHAVKEFDRFENDVAAYNAAALHVVRALDIPVNDLYTAVVTHGRDRIMSPDGVHYTVEGYKLLGEKVLSTLLSYL